MKDQGEKVYLTEVEARKFKLIPAVNRKSNQPITQTLNLAIYDRLTARRAGLNPKDIKEHTIEQEELPF